MCIRDRYRNKDTPTWYSDNLGAADIWLPDSQRFRIDSHGCGDGFVWRMSSSITYVSCYFTPNERIDIFRARMDGLEDVIQKMEVDFYAKALEWGIPEPDRRDERVVAMSPRLDLVVLSIGRTSTFKRPGCRKTILDISLASEHLVSRIRQ